MNINLSLLPIAITVLASFASTLTHASVPPASSPEHRQEVTVSKEDQSILQLSKDKWRWMSERKVDLLSDLFHEKSVFVHMGATMTKTQELDTIKGGGIQYKEIEIQKSSVRTIGTTAIVLNTIRLVAVVGGNEVTNPFEVTEVYVQVEGKWKLASLSFTRLLR